MKSEIIKKILLIMLSYISSGVGKVCKVNKTLNKLIMYKKILKNHACYKIGLFTCLHTIYGFIYFYTS